MNDDMKKQDSQHLEKVGRCILPAFSSCSVPFCTCQVGYIVILCNIYCKYIVPFVYEQVNGLVQS